MRSGAGPLLASALAGVCWLVLALRVWGQVAQQPTPWAAWDPALLQTIADRRDDLQTVPWDPTQYLNYRRPR